MLFRPQKLLSSQVLFCRLSPEQRELYRAYLACKDVEAILAGDRNALAGIDVLRKICNHPDLLQVRHTALPVSRAASTLTRGLHTRRQHMQRPVIFVSSIRLLCTGRAILNLLEMASCFYAFQQHGRASCICYSSSKLNRCCVTSVIAVLGCSGPPGRTRRATAPSSGQGSCRS